MQGRGISSESIWTVFDSVTTATVRPVRARVFISWNRVVDVSSYAIIGTSLVGGTDIVQGVGGADINESDSFLYVDETDNVIRIEYERVLIEPLGGTSLALADIVLDNSDLRFTKDFDLTIGTAIKPNRPIKIFIGFEVRGQEKLIPIIEGLSLQPKEDKLNRTLTITVVDFMSFINQKPQETTIYTDQRSDQIIADILARAGVGSSSYELDEGLNTIGFAWFEKGQTAGERIKLLCEAEEAIFFQDETGTLRFENRDKYGKEPYTSSVWDIEADDILQWKQDFSSEIINRALIKGAPRSVKGEAELWRNGVEEEIAPGDTLTIWADFEDPASSLTSPSANTDYEAHSQTGGAGTDITGDVDIVMTSFTKAAKLEITNNHGSLTAFVNLLKIRGTPATVDYEIQEVFEDDTSISDFNEQQKEIDNPYIDKRAFAANMAQNIVRRHKNPVNMIRLTVRGIPQLQLRDQIRVKDQDLDTYTNYRVINIQGIFQGGSFIQILKLRTITSDESL